MSRALTPLIRCPFVRPAPPLTTPRALRQNRLDDANLDIIRNRLEVYQAETRPVLDHYGDALVHTIDSTQSPVLVLRDTLEILANLEA